ncbi:ribonuclease H-like domain-containing protein [Mycena epipterygia]|nr:ribonuclease H-like domain-containing protein [Mycena epipterygia]
MKRCCQCIKRLFLRFSSLFPVVAPWLSSGLTVLRMSKKATASSSKPSSNWLALQKVLPKAVRKRDSEDFPRKRRKIEHSSSPPPRSAPNVAQQPLQPMEPVESSTVELKNGESLPALRKMIFGKMEYTDVQRQPGKFLALDCEMVGVGPEGVESSLARRERVVDYRTEFSGVRESDMIHAKPFDQIQKQVAALLKDRILVGHAVFNDLKVLLLSHPRPQTRDTQYYAGKFKVAKSKYVALRNLVKQELDVTIQGGEHSSVTDARATMAVYRLHRREWEKGSAPLARVGKKRKRDGEESEEDEDEPVAGKKSSGSFPGGGRKGVSSGLSTVVRRGAGGHGGDGAREKTEWWKELGGGGTGSKHRLSV